MKIVSCRHGRRVKMDYYDRRVPRYLDNDSDFSTNAESYYKNLARKERLIKELSLMIAEYDEELAKRFAEWDQLISRFPEDVRILLEQWLLDGTLGEILTDVFLSGKSNIVTSSLEPEFVNNQTYWHKITDKIDITYPTIGGDIGYDEI